MSGSYLHRLIEYNTWANQGLLEFIATQPPQNADPAILRGISKESVRRLDGFADPLPEPGKMIHLDDGMRAAAMILAQLFMHSCEHRTHICTILGAQGFEPPDLDSWRMASLSAGTTGTRSGALCPCPCRAIRRPPCPEIRRASRLTHVGSSLFLRAQN